jgi:hypothetical protein
MREIVLGRSAKIWKAISTKAGVTERFGHAIGHAQLPSFEFTPQDRVWVFAYSTEASENTAMLTRLKQAGVAEIVYITSSSTLIAPLTDCYAYPRAKKRAEDEAAQIPNCKILTLGLVVESLDELPAGVNAAITHDEIAQFMLNPVWPVDQGRRAHLLRRVERPFAHGGERALYALYGMLMSALSRQPCLLRPVDLVLRTLNMRWYGYTFLSNRLWSQRDFA